jgi:sortase A
MLGYCGFVLVDAWIFQKGERRQLERLLHDRPAARDARRQTASPSPPKDSPPAVTGGLIGWIEIPRLGLSAIVVEGTDRYTLRRGVGHIPGTALPGQPGNAAITGHRDTFFRPLRNIRQSDIITLTTLLGEYRYRVVSTTIVSPRDVAVLDPSGNEILTLVTCYPFYFVGPAPNRFIVRAERVAG